MAPPPAAVASFLRARRRRPPASASTIPASSASTRAKEKKNERLKLPKRRFRLIWGRRYRAVAVLARSVRNREPTGARPASLRGLEVPLAWT